MPANTSAISGIIKITLAEGGKTFSQDAEIAKTFNKYFVNIPVLNTPDNQSFFNQTCSSG